MWDDDGVSSGVTSPALVMNFNGQDSDVSRLSNFMGVKVKQTVSIPNPNSIITSTVTPRFIPLDHDQLLYHRIELASVHDAIILFLTSSIRHVKYDVYFRSGEFPTASEYDYKTGIPSTWTVDGNTKLKVMCPERSLPQAGSVFIGLRPYDLGKIGHLCLTRWLKLLTSHVERLVNASREHRFQSTHNIQRRCRPASIGQLAYQTPIEYQSINQSRPNDVQFHHDTASLYRDFDRLS